ncbi:MAG: MFS transporter [Pseudomonadota bacterium]
MPQHTRLRAADSRYAWTRLALGALGSATTFAPLVADTSLWFVRRRGIAVAICASGNYLGGAIWPPIVQHFVASDGWRHTCIGLGIFSAVAMAGLAQCMRPRPPVAVAVPASRATGAAPSTRPFGLSMGHAQALLCIAGVACCVAMAMPQVHIVAYCSDLGFGTARGAEMLSLMLACGIVSRVVSGAICDRIGGLRTLLLGSVLQGLALLLFLPFDGLVSLYVISALFGLFQGGIVPSYAIIVREHFPAAGLACGIVSRVVSGAICDRIGGLRTLLLGSVLQGLALLLFLPFDGLVSLYVISALFGLFQGGIVPSYAIIVREHFPAAGAGARVGTVIMATLFGMALGGWMSGKVFDLTGSYHAAFLNGIAWNLLNLTIALFLLGRMRALRRRAGGLAGAG